MKILMVCLGNICRSPLADGLLRHKIEKLNLDFIVDSAGTSNFHVGEAPDSRMRETARQLGVSIENLRARQFNVNDFDQFDIIYVMDQSNLKNILTLARNNTDSAKVKLILEETHPGQNLEVPDPYFGGEKGFIEVYHLLDDATDAIINKLEK